MEQIQALTQLYLPFNQAKLKEALGTGKMDLEHDGANGDAIILYDYAKAGDQLKLMLDRATMQIDRISVKTYFEEPKDEAPAKKLSIATVDSDFSKAVY